MLENQSLTPVGTATHEHPGSILDIGTQIPLDTAFQACVHAPSVKTTSHAHGERSGQQYKALASNSKGLHLSIQT